MSVTPLAVAEVTQRGRRKPTALTLDLAGVRAAIAELQRAERVLLAAQAAADAPADASGEASPAEPGVPADDDEDGPMDDEAELRRAAAADDPPAAAGPDGQDPLDPATWGAVSGAQADVTGPGSSAGVGATGPGSNENGSSFARQPPPIRKAEMLDVTGGREVLVWGDPRIDEVLAAGGTLVRTFDVLIEGAVREWTAPRSHPELFLVPNGKATAAAAAS